jgi:hypothetical protein
MPHWTCWAAGSQSRVGLGDETPPRDDFALLAALSKARGQTSTKTALVETLRQAAHRKRDSRSICFITASNTRSTVNPRMQAWCPKGQWGFWHGAQGTWCRSIMARGW